MVDLLKAFGRGVLYVILLPFFLLALAIFAVIGLGDFIFQIIKSIFYFFTGQKFFPELPEDRELRLRRENAAAKVAAMEAAQANKEANERISSQFYHDNGVFEDLNQPYQAPAPEREQPIPNPVPPKPSPFGRVPEQSLPKEREDLSHLLNDESKEEEPLFEEVNNDEPEEYIGSNFEPEEEMDEEEILEEYHPKESRFSGQVNNDDDDTDNGVNIKFDD